MKEGQSQYSCLYEKGAISPLNGGNQDGAIKIFVATLTRGFRHEHAGVRGGFM